MAQAGHLQVEAHLEHSPKNFQTNLRCSYPVRRMDSPEYEKAAPTKYRTLPNTGHCINALHNGAPTLRINPPQYLQTGCGSPLNAISTMSLRGVHTTSCGLIILSVF